VAWSIFDGMLVRLGPKYLILESTDAFLYFRLNWLVSAGAAAAPVSKYTLSSKRQENQVRQHYIS
jgi:hypothetical protein